MYCKVLLPGTVVSSNFFPVVVFHVFLYKVHAAGKLEDIVTIYVETAADMIDKGKPFLL